MDKILDVNEMNGDAVVQAVRISNRTELFATNSKTTGRDVGGSQ